MFKSIQSSLIFAVVVVVFISSLTVLGVALRESERSFTLNAKNGVLGLTRSLSQTLEDVVNSKSQTEKVMNYFELYPNVVLAKLISADGKSVVYDYISRFPEQDIQNARDLIAKQTIEKSLGTVEVDQYLLTTTAFNKEITRFSYLVVVSDINGPLIDNRKDLLVKLAPLVLLVMLMSVFVTIWLINRITLPVIQLSEFTKRVRNENDYSLRSPPKGTHEVVTLKRNINAMMDTISAELAKNTANTDRLLEQQKLMSKLANYDSLTGLPNRQFVLDNLRLELSRAKRAGQEISLLFFDLDGFKSVNDSLGHETGDSLLIGLSERIKEVLREGDLFARLGGDEFLIVPDKNTKDETNALTLAERVLQAMERPILINEIELQMSVSIGIAMASDVDYDLSRLIGNADIAMYRSKANGRGRFTVFTDDMNEDNKRKLEVANSIVAGLEADEFSVYYQPKVDLQGRLLGYEALLRWEHSSMGHISPVEFIPIAEQSGKIRIITAWVLKQVCKEMAQICALKSPNIRVSINLSAHDLHDKKLYDHLVRMLDEYQVNPKNIELEVTESAFLESFRVSNEFFKKVHNLGCTVALDDFGTGYSSLSYLTQMTVDTLKIDREFIKELDSSERSRLVTQSIIDLAKRLKLSVCAEGVENEFQQNYLTENQCHQFQGFYYGKALPLDKLADTPNEYQAFFEHGENAKHADNCEQDEQSI